MLTLIAAGSEIKETQFQVGDMLAGFYMGKYPFQGEFVGSQSGFLRHGGQYTLIQKIQVKLTTDCERPMNGLFKAGETIMVYLSGNEATELVMHSR